MRPSRSWPAAALAVLAVTVSLPAPAFAAPTAKDRADAHALVNDARKAMKEKRWSDAVAALKKADKLDPSPALEVELAQAQEGAGKLVEAQRTLAAIVGGTDPAFPAKKAREAAGKALEDLKARVPTVKVKIDGPPAGKATVLVDGIEVEGDEVAVNPGDHTVGAEAKGFASAEKELHLAEGAREEVQLHLAARAPAGATAEQPRGSRIPGIAVTSVGGAGLLLGAVFGGLAFQATSTAKAHCKGDLCPPSAASDVSRSKTFGNVSTGMFVAGGAIAVTGIALIIVAPGGGKPEEAPRAAGARLSPWLGPGVTGLGATGTF
jgi:hypothetical protein